MYKLLLPLCLVLFVSSVQAQNKAIIKGKITDSLKNEVLEFATVAIVNMKDTTSELVSYTLSDKKGEFTLHNLPSGIPIKVLITFIGYKPYRKLLTLGKGESVDLGTIRLNAKLLNEVVITGERLPVTVKKDTVEFAAEAFKTRPNAVVEELLKKLPGMEIDNNGAIMFNGKKVNKILVDGREFFSQDIRIASKNLDAELIDKVQVYDDRENDPDHLIDDSRVEKIVNLKFKKKLIKSVFGKVYAGGGTERRYESGGLFNVFRDTLQVSLLGLSNNLSNTGFSFNDLYSTGGLNRGGGEAISRGGGISYGGFGAGISGIQQTTSGGANINNDYGKKLKINVAYYYSHDSNNFNGMNNRQQFTGDTAFTTNTANSRLRIDNKNTVSMSIKAKPDDATQITYTPIFSYADNNSTNASTTTSFSNFVPLVNKTVNSDNNNGNNLNFNQSFNYNHQFKAKGQSINIDHNFQINPDNSDDYAKNALTSYISSFPSYTLDRYSNNRNKNTSANINVSYRYPIGKKIVFDVNGGTDYNYSVNKGSVYDFDPATGLYDVFQLSLSNDLTRNLWKEHISPGVTYAITQRVSLVLGIAAQWQQIDNQFARGIPDLNQDYFNILPNARLSFGSYTTGSYSISYQESVNQPNIGDLIPYSIVFSPLYAVTGNPGLKQQMRHNISLNYNKYNPQSQTSLSMNGNFAIEENAVFRERTLDATGAETSTPINKNGRYSSYLSTYFNKRFKKHNDLDFSAGTNLSFNQSHNFFEINHQDGYQNSYGVNLNERFSINWKDIITLDPSYTLSTSVSDYTGVNYASIHNTTHSFSTPYNIYWPAHMDIEGTYSYTYNPLVSPGFQKSTNLLNVSIARQFLAKDRAEIKLSCYDILNQAISSSRSIYENVISDTQSQIINRYFLLTLRWKFNSSKFKEKKEFNMSPVRFN